MMIDGEVRLAILKNVGVEMDCDGDCGLNVIFTVRVIIQDKDQI